MDIHPPFPTSRRDDPMRRAEQRVYDALAHCVNNATNYSTSKSTKNAENHIGPDFHGL